MRRFWPLIILLIATAAFAGRVNVQNFETTGATGECFVRDTSAPLGGAWTTCPGGGGGISDGDKGDITVTGSGSTWTIDPDVVSDAKLRNSAASSVIGRSSASGGDPADITSSADGQVLRRGAAGVVAFGAVDLADTDAVTGTLQVGRGGTGLSGPSANDTIMVSDGATWQVVLLPDCDDSGGNHINYNTATNTFSCGTSSSGGGGGLTHQQVMTRAGFGF